ncbi:MAG: ATP-binding protein [Thermoleophilia bacterium]
MLRRAPRLSLGVKLGATVLAVVLVALGVVYVAVVPRLESRLVDAKLDDLERSALNAFQLLSSDTTLFDNVGGPSIVALFASENQARVIVLQRLDTDRLAVYLDSKRPSTPEVETDQVATRVLTSDEREVQRGRVRRQGFDYAEVALPLRSRASFVLLFSAQLDDTLRSIELIRNSLLVSGALALAIAWFAGAAATYRLARRIRRLEGAAERIASGDFAQPVVDEGRDELGDLADAFERMRLRLDQLDGARRAFIANASHELRTPLFSLGGFLELLADEEIDEETRREFTDQMREQVDRLTRLTTDLLDLSRMDAGQLALDVGPVDLAECAGTLVDEFRGVAEATDHPLELVPGAAAYGVADEQRVLRIGRALLENALRHTPPGTRVRVSTARVGGRAELRVEDEGPGIPAEHVGRLFERFYRGDGGAAFGSGLGLAIAGELAQRMGGSIEVSSRPGRTTFTLGVPFSTDPPPFSRENAPDLTGHAQ